MAAPRCKRALMWGLALLPLSAVCLALACWPRGHVRWTPHRLHQALRDAGLNYDGREFNANGLYCLKRPADSTPWDELASMTVRRLSAARGRLRIGYSCARLPLLMDVEDGYLQVDNLVIAGHPDDLRRLARVIAW
jgi:hypothetical protein